MNQYLMNNFKCIVCGKEPDLLVLNHPFCTECSKKLSREFLVNYDACRAWKFIPITSESILDLAKLTIKNSILLSSSFRN